MRHLDQDLKVGPVHVRICLPGAYLCEALQAFLGDGCSGTKAVVMASQGVQG
jgi:hypothetical protein